MMENMDEEQLRSLIDNIDDREIAAAEEWLFEEFILPDLREVRQRARNDPPNALIRERFAGLPEDEKEELFYDTLDTVTEALVLCREDPKSGWRRLKPLLRDPFTAEALMLIWENEDHIDPEYSEQLKEFWMAELHHFGVMLLPEMYDEDERQAVRQDLGIDPPEDG